MARPSTQAERRADIRTATARLLRKESVSRIGLSDVAHEMGLSANAIRYYYSDINGLLADLVAHGVDRFVTRRQEAIAGQDPLDQLATLIRLGLPHGLEDREVWLMWQVTIADVEQASATILSDIFGRQVAMYQSALETGAGTGQFTLQVPAISAAKTLVSLEDYYGLRIVVGDPTFDREAALALIREYAEVAVGAALPAIS
ncbi:MAG: TetR/AcrR family transcriptional regulator [Beutenbergiaceae bacterium]